MSTRERFPHLYKGCFVLLPNQCGILQSSPPSGPSVLSGTRSFLQSIWAHRVVSTPLRGTASLLAHRPVSSSSLGFPFQALCLPPFGEQPPRWHIAPCLALIPFVTGQAHRQQILSSLGFPFQASLQGF